MSETQKPPDQDSPEIQDEQPDVNKTSGQPQEDFSVNPENAQEILNREWDEDLETWKKADREENRKNILERLTEYRKRLRLAKKRKSQLGLTAPTTAWDSEIEECQTQIRQLLRELYGPDIGTVEEDQLLNRKRKQVSAHAQSGSQINIDELSEWFKEALDLQDRFFVITLSIFNGIKYPDFKDINEILLAEISSNLREEDRERKTLDSYFEKSDDERLEICRAEVCSKDGETEEIIRFINDEYPDAIFSLLRKRYHNLLLDLLPALKSVVERHRYWEIRFWSALAVAEIGKIGFTRMERQVLNPWAMDKRAYVRAAVGYPLAYLADEKRDDVRKLLNKWSDPTWGGHLETWRYRWTVASTYKQIGLIGQDWARDWAYEGLKKIARYDDIRLVDAVIHSLVVLSLQGELERTLSALKDWIDEFCQKKPNEQTSRDVESQYLTALLAFMRLCEIHTADPLAESDTDSDIESDSQYHIGNILSLMERSRATSGDVWQLAVGIGTSTFKFRIEDLFFSLITFWTEYASDTSEYQTTITNLVAEVFTGLESRDKKLVWNLLRRWEQHSRDEGLANMASMARTEIKRRVL